MDGDGCGAKGATKRKRRKAVHALQAIHKGIRHLLNQRPLGLCAYDEIGKTR